MNTEQKISELKSWSMAELRDTYNQVISLKKTDRRISFDLKQLTETMLQAVEQEIAYREQMIASIPGLCLHNKAFSVAWNNSTKQAHVFMVSYPEWFNGSRRAL